MKKNLISKTALIIVLLFIISFVYLLSLKFFDNKTDDFFTKVITSIEQKKASDKIVLIAIDEKSVSKIKWPWTKDLFADLYDYLNNYAHAKVVVFHNLVMFPDTYNIDKDNIFYNALKRSDNIINSYIPVNSNLAGDVLSDEYTSIFDKKNNLNIVDKRKNKNYSSYKAVFNLPKGYLLNSVNLASSMLVEDDDTIMRNYMPVIRLGNKLYPSLALSAYSKYTGITDFNLYDDFLCSADDNCKLLKMPVQNKQFRDYLGNNVKGEYTKVNWYLPISKGYSHKKFSAIDVLNSYYSLKTNKKPIVADDEFKNKIVIIGLNADRSVWEQLSETPVMKKHSDIDIQAVIIDNMLDNTFKSPAKFDATFFITFLFSLFVIFGFRRLKYNIFLASGLSLIYIVYYFMQYSQRIYIPPVTPILTIYVSALLKQLYSIITTDKSTELIKRAMGKFVSKDVMKKVLADIDKLKLGGIRAVVTVLFVDIRNFTQIAENLSPQDVTSILNEYFSQIEPVIAKYNGIINKYIGDGVLAVFGEPIKDENHPLNAIKCGMEITEKVDLLKEKFLKEGKPKIEIGIGINTGEVFAGNVGTEERLEYTVIGDEVNLASRIEAYNHVLKTSFLISQYTYEYVKDYVDTVKLSSFYIKGKSKPIDIYEVLKLKNE